MNEIIASLPDSPKIQKKWFGGFSFWSAEPSGEKSKLILLLHVLRQGIRLLILNRLGTQAAALSYHTIFGVVPLAIVMLMVFQMFPAYKEYGDKVKKMAYEQMNLTKMDYPSDKPGEPKINLAQKIDEITGSFMSNLNTGAIAFTGGLLIFWAAIGLLTTIEKAFNMIWGVHHSRDFLHRTINYWALLTLGPLLMGVGIYLGTHPVITHVLKSSIFHFVRPLFSYFLSVVLIFCFYAFIPNARVKSLAALFGAVVAAILWTVAKYGFGVYVTKLIPYQSVYGIMGLIPLAVFWIYIVWWIVLIGLQLTYAAQHVYSLDRAEKMAELRQKQASFIATEQTVIQIMQEVMIAFEDKDRKPIVAAEISDATTLPADFIERILENMTSAGLLCRTSEPTVGYVPSTDGGKITLADVSLAVEKSSFKAQSPKLQQVIALLRVEMSRYNLKDIL